MFHYFWVTTNFMLQRVMSPFSVENILPNSAEKLGRGTHLCFTELLVSKTVLENGGLGE